MGQKKETQVVENKVDPIFRDAFQDQMQRVIGSDSIFQPFTGQRFADPSQDQQTAFGATRSLFETGAGGQSEGLDVARQAASFQPGTVGGGANPMVQPGALPEGVGFVGPGGTITSRNGPGGLVNTGATPSQQPSQGQAQFDVRDVTAPGASGAPRVRAQQVSPLSFLDRDISDFQNPFQQQVIDASLGDLNRQRQLVQNQNADAAQAAGAFGGSRQGVVEAETNRAFADRAGNLAANLRSRGFDTAAGLLNQDIGRNFQGQLANQQAGLTASQANASNALRGNLAGLDARMRAQLANQGADLDQARLGLQERLAGREFGLRGQELGLRGDIANQRAGLDANQQRLAAAGLLGDLSSQGQANQMRNIDALFRSGGIQNAFDQRGLDFGFNEFLRQQNDQMRRLGLINQTLGLFPGSAGTSSQDLFSNRAAGFAGGAATGAGIGSIGGPPGMIIGAGLGGLAGLF